MKLSCNVVRDLLPLYYDGVCSDESRALVEEHVKDCPDCAAVLEELRGEIEVPHEEPNEAAVLKKLRKNVKRTWLRGAAAVLAAVVLAFGCWYARWYVQEHCYYRQFAQGRQPLYEKNIFQWTSGSYAFYVCVPQYPGDRDGVLYVDLVTEENTVNIIPGQEVHVWLNFGREEYTYLVGLEVRTRTQIPGEPRLETEVWTEYLMLDRELNLIFDDYMNEQMRMRQMQVYQDYGQEIMDIIEAAQAQWPFLTE